MKIHHYHHILFDNPLVLRTEPPQDGLLQAIVTRLTIMPTNDDLAAKLAEVEAALTEEIQQITDALSAAGVSQANLDRLTALRDRISGIINP